MRKKHGELLSSITIKILVTMVLLLLPLNILVIISTAQAISVVQEQTRISLENVANLYMQQLDGDISSVNYYFYDLAEHDADFIRISRRQSGDAYTLSKTAMANKLKSNLETAAIADGYFFYAQNLNDFYIVTSGRISPSDSNRARAIRSELTKWLLAADLPDLERWNIIKVNEGEWLLRVVSINDFYYGALISLDEVFHSIGEAVSFSRLTIGVNTGSDAPPENGLFTVTGKSSKIPLSLYLSVPKRDVIMSLPFIQWVGIILAIAYLSLIPLFFILLRHILLRPLGNIRNALLHLKTGDKDYRIGQSNVSEEFHVINQSFNEMADSIEHLKIENYEKEVERQKMELRNLQLQIRPHFLLNMFKLVYGLAQIQDYVSIQKLALYLSNYFRYIFRSGKELEPFDQENDLVREYLDISMIRYPDRFTVEYNVDDAVSSVEVPPLLLHNFVENIINHALRSGATVHIKLSASYVDGWVVLCVWDDGSGMEPDIVKQINNGQFRASDGKRVHLGIFNSYQRIRYFYGEESTINVMSTLGEGTCVTIRFPYGTEGEQ